MGWEPAAPKDLVLFPGHLRDAAVAVGPDFIWPVDLAAEVIGVLTEAGAVIRGIEAWMVDEEGIPAVVGWSDYDLEEHADDRVAQVGASRAEAEMALAGVLEATTRDEVNYIGVDWQLGADWENARS